MIHLLIYVRKIILLLLQADDVKSEECFGANIYAFLKRCNTVPYCNYLTIFTAQYRQVSVIYEKSVKEERKFHFSPLFDIFLGFTVFTSKCV